MQIKHNKQKSLAFVSHVALFFESTSKHSQPNNRDRQTGDWGCFPKIIWGQSMLARFLLEKNRLGSVGVLREIQARFPTEKKNNKETVRNK